MTLNEVLKNTNYDVSLFSEEARKYVEDAIVVKTIRGKESLFIKCLKRDKEIALKPEEAVRQLYLYKLIHEYGYPTSRIEVEFPIHFGREVKRADIAIMDKDRLMVPYRTSGSKKLIVDDQIMASMEQVYREGRKVIMEQYPEYYLWDFYHVNEDFEYTFKDIPPDKSDCLIIGLKISRNRGTKWQFVISGFARFFGKYYEEYNGNVQFQCNISGILESSTEHVKENPTESEQDYLSWLLREINVALAHSIVEAFKLHYENNAYGKRLLVKIGDLEKRIISLVWQIFALNAKDETFKTLEEMGRSRNTYELIQQRPLNYFQYHFDVDWLPQRDLSASEKEWFRKLHESRRQNSVLWFLDFVYRLRNALFHEIIDPLDEEWQVIFKNAYLVLKEIVDLNIAAIETR